MDWREKRAWAAAEHTARSERAPEEGEREDFRLAAVAGASWAEGLAAWMGGDASVGRSLLRRAADEYLASWAVAPPGSWGRPIAAMRCRLLAGDDAGLLADADATLAAGAARAEGAIAAYATTLALLGLMRDDEARRVAGTLRAREDFVPPVGDALAAIAAADAPAYLTASAAVLHSFEEREAFLEDVPVADTVLVLDALAAARGIETPTRASTLLPS